jgi:hypothetical protein
MIRLKSMARREHVCTGCGSKDIGIRRSCHTVDFRDLPLEVDGLEEMVCQACELVWTTLDQQTSNQNSLNAAYSTRVEATGREERLTGKQSAAASCRLH